MPFHIYLRGTSCMRRAVRLLLSKTNIVCYPPENLFHEFLFGCLFISYFGRPSGVRCPRHEKNDTAITTLNHPEGRVTSA